MLIDRSAIVDSGAQIDDDVTIGAYSVIGSDVVIRSGSVIGSHVVIKGPTHIGQHNKIYQFSSIGDDPQDKKYTEGELSTLQIGDGNVIREYCTINRGTAVGGGKTRIGNANWIMAYVHIAHDCAVGDHCVFANNATLGGHVEVSNYAVLGGFTAVHQFCRLGKHCCTAGGSIVVKDVPPFMMVSGYTAKACGLNREGLKRHSFKSDTIDLLRQAYKIVYRQGLTRACALEALEDLASQLPEIRELSDFIKHSSRGIVPARFPRSGDA